jgi:hypothetical protein
MNTVDINDSEVFDRVLGRVWHGYGKTCGVSKMGKVGTGTVCDFGTLRHTAYPYPWLWVFHGYITPG